MKNTLLTLFALFLLCSANGQETVRYIPRVSGGDVQLSIVVTYAPSGASGYSNTQYVHQADTTALRRYINSERAYWQGEATRLNDAAEAAQARVDSLYAALEMLNEGIGAVEDKEPTWPTTPDTKRLERWGAILRDEESEIG